jgi:hypothetical protein
MQPSVAFAVVSLVAISSPGLLRAQMLQVPVCPSFALAQQAQQAPGSPLPSGCRMVGVRRVDTPSGPICAVDFSEDVQGLLGDILESTVPTRWWTPCANLSPP